MADAAGMSCELLADALLRSNAFEAVPAATHKGVLERVQGERFDVLLISTSLALDTVDGLHFLRQVRDLYPALSIVVLLDSPERNIVVEAFRCGARGVFCRTDSFQALCKCIHCVQQGQVWASSTELLFLLEALVEPAPIVTRDLPGARTLSKREEEIARLVAEGFSNRQISERLDLSEHTIKNYLFRVFEKLGVSTRVELTLYALKRGRIAPSAPRGLEPALRPKAELLGSENLG